MNLPTQIKRHFDYQISFGGVELHSTILAPHFLIFGTTQAGKTLCIRMILRTALLTDGQLRGRCMLYDGKREYYPMLVGMGVPPELIYILNPADSRCAAWDLAGDIRTRDDARNIVELLIPDEQNRNDNPFFPLAVRSLVTEVMMELHETASGKWILNDVVNALRTPAILRRVLGKTREGREVCERYFTEAKEAVGGIISTIDARFIAVYDSIARIWARCGRSIRLTDWIRGRSAILLGYDANRSAVDRINQAIFQRAAQLATSLPENAAVSLGETWIVLDEQRFLGKLPMLPELVSFGRTKGVRVIQAPQDIDGLYAVYGEHLANELLALCGNIAVLHIDSTKTREWASKFFGDYEAWERDYGGSVTEGASVNRGHDTSHGESSSCNYSWNQRIVKRESILSSEFLNLPMTNRINGMNGFFATARMGAWRARIPADFIDAHLPRNDRKALPFIPRAESALAPLRWTREEEQRYTTNIAEPETGLFDEAKPAEQAVTKTEPRKPEPKVKKPPKRRGSLPSW